MVSYTTTWIRPLSMRTFSVYLSRLLAKRKTLKVAAFHHHHHLLTCNSNQTSRPAWSVDRKTCRSGSGAVMTGKVAGLAFESKPKRAKLKLFTRLEPFIYRNTHHLHSFLIGKINQIKEPVGNDLRDIKSIGYSRMACSIPTKIDVESGDKDSPVKCKSIPWGATRMLCWQSNVRASTMLK